MALGIYKPGQGYWVRVLSAVGLGALILATAAWAWGQAVNLRLPARAFTFELAQVQQSPVVGSTVSLFELDALTGERVTIGAGVVESYSSAGTGGVVQIGSVTTEPGKIAANSDLLGEAGSANLASVVRYDQIPVIEPLYVQGAIVAVVLLVGMFLVFYLIGSKKNTVDFLIATDGEMRKVNWSSRREIMGSTWVVIAAAFLISGALFIIDYAFSTFFRLIDVLQT
jgi:preprotein translocase SecE subunit